MDTINKVRCYLVAKPWLNLLWCYFACYLGVIFYSNKYFETQGYFTNILKHTIEAHFTYMIILIPYHFSKFSFMTYLTGTGTDTGTVRYWVRYRTYTVSYRKFEI